MPLGYGIECVRIPHCVSLSSLRTCLVRARLWAYDLASDGASGLLARRVQHAFLFSGELKSHFVARFRDE